MSESPPLSPPFRSLPVDLVEVLKGSWSQKRHFSDVRGSIMPLKNSNASGPRAWLAYISSRNIRRYLVTLAILLMISLLCARGRISSSVMTLKSKFMTEYPPLYEAWYELESRLPQQDPSLPYPEGSEARFFYAANHVWGLGFNNALQEQLLLAHLAYVANRTFVFDNYVWDPREDEPYSMYNGKLIPSRIPYTAIVAGPNAGGPFEDGIKAPRAVSKPYYQSMCPHPTKIKSDALDRQVGRYADVSIMMRAWGSKLREAPSKCMQMDDSDQLFNYMVFGMGQRLLPFLEEFLRSPILKAFRWSSLIDSAVSSNGHLIAGGAKAGWLSWFTGTEPNALAADPNSPISGLLSIHIRRGDFEYHCRERAKWGSTYMGWLENPELPDHFEVDPATYVQTDETTKQYMSHCWPTPDEIVAKIAEVRRTEEGKSLNRVFIMTNGPTNWVNDLERQITNMGGWKGVSSSRDLSLTPEQKYIAQAVDMAVAMRSQVFIGNGFSSLSANVIVLRLSRGFSAMVNRLW